MDKQNLNRVNYGATRKQSYIIPKRGIIQRYPLVFITFGTIVGLGIFFSRPIYDAFFRPPVFHEPTTPEERRRLIQEAWRI